MSATEAAELLTRIHRDLLTLSLAAETYELRVPEDCLPADLDEIAWGIGEWRNAVLKGEAPPPDLPLCGVRGCPVDHATERRRDAEYAARHNR